MATDSLLRPVPADVPRHLTDGLAAGWKVIQAIVCLPFDAMSAQYTNAVRAGLIENSILASRDVGRAIESLERLTLGPFARRV